MALDADQLVEAGVSGYPIWAHHHVVTPNRCLQSITARPRTPDLLATGESSTDVESRVRDPVPTTYLRRLIRRPAQELIRHCAPLQIYKAEENIFRPTTTPGSELPVRTHLQFRLRASRRLARESVKPAAGRDVGDGQSARVLPPSSRS
jgi:hypothetical protein